MEKTKTLLNSKLIKVKSFSRVYLASSSRPGKYEEDSSGVYLRLQAKFKFPDYEEDSSLDTPETIIMSKYYNYSLPDRALETLRLLGGDIGEDSLGFTVFRLPDEAALEKFTKMMNKQGVEVA